MTRLERHLLVDCLALGLVMTLLVIAADVVGVLRQFENFLYDRRARACQFFMPKPTDRLVHLDIDDRALEVIGGWPWPRARWAELFDEIRLAGPKAVEMDIILPEKQKPDVEQLDQGKVKVTDNDALLAESIEKLGNVTLPLSLKVEPPPPEFYSFMVELFRGDPEGSETEVMQRVGARFNVNELEMAGTVLKARRQAVYGLVASEVAAGNEDVAAIQRKLLRRSDPELKSPLGRLVNDQFERAQAIRAFDRFSFPVPAEAADIALANIMFVPIRPLSESAIAGAFVDYVQIGNLNVRSLPLLLRSGDRVYPTMGLRLAGEMLDADLSRMRIAPGRELIIPRKQGGDLHVPFAPPATTNDGVRVGTLFNVPWMGSYDWQTMYDWPRHQRIARHMSVNGIWEACRTRQRLTENLALIDSAARQVYSVQGKFDFQLLPPGEVTARLALIDQVLADAQETLPLLTGLKDDELDEPSRAFLASIKALPRLRSETMALDVDLKKQRDELSSALKDKAILIGWIATSSIADFVPTSLHEKSPGVVVHGAVFNGIMTGEMWRTAPAIWGVIATLVIGLATAFTTARFAPLRALIIALAIGCLFAAVNGYILFDYFNLIFPAAAPLIAIGAVWSFATLTRVVIEATERRRITGRFRNYVDPKLVSYVEENTEQVRFDGEKREMTVVFSDIAGFTSLSEKLGEKIVPLLNELLSELVPVIRDHHEGYVNKFLGDGIMFFYGAPRETSHHAIDAVSTVLDMYTTTERFNLRLQERGLPTITLRAGISSGVMVVGDAGGGGAADYTVLGDVVNLGSRLEAANKAVGTRTLITERTRELLDGQFILRPVGRLKVVGKDEAVMTYEPIARAGEATDDVRAMAAMFERLVETFTARKFEECIDLAHEIDETGGHIKLVGLYRELSEHNLRKPPGDDFDGRIVLTEK